MNGRHGLGPPGSGPGGPACVWPTRRPRPVTAPDARPAAAPARQSATSGAVWEERYGYCRAVRVGPVVAVAGTTAPGPDAASQARAAFQTALGALAELGGTAADVVRTRMYVVDIAAHADAVGRAHAEVFGAVPPAATMVGVAALVAPELLVEVELDAVVPERAGA